MSEATDQHTRTWSDVDVKRMVKAAYIEGFQAGTPKIVHVTSTMMHPSDVGRLADESFTNSRAFDSIAAFFGPGVPGYDQQGDSALVSDAPA